MDKTAFILIVGATLLFASIWGVVSMVVSRTGGWKSLADRFPAPGRPTGTRFGIQSGMVGTAAYNGFLTIHSSRAGFYLSVSGPFRIGHRPLFIPWDAVHNRTTRRLLWAETVVFEVDCPKVAVLELPKAVFREFDLRAWRPQPLEVEEPAYAEAATRLALAGES